jgi:hypothetical protein
MNVRRAKNGDVLVRLTEEQALDLATLIGFIGGECEARETTNVLYFGLSDTLRPKPDGVWHQLFESRKRWRGANFETLGYNLGK